jgi:hypothetical protein
LAGLAAAASWERCMEAMQNEKGRREAGLSDLENLR